MEIRLKGGNMFITLEQAIRGLQHLPEHMRKDALRRWMYYRIIPGSMFIKLAKMFGINYDE